jgi:hypothetical protein
VERGHLTFNHFTILCFLTAPVDGHWGRWSSWTSCSTQCGPGTRSRVRTCDDPVPRNGGKNCTEEKMEEKSCVFQSCGLGNVLNTSRI